MALGQPLNDTGHARKFVGEGSDESRPQAMPTPDAHANKAYFGRSGLLKAGRPKVMGGGGNDHNGRSIQVQRSKRRK